jgi:ribosomal protein S18 acetylase RimI-like enzyme
MEFIIRTTTSQDYKELCGVFMEVHSLHVEAVPSAFRKLKTSEEVKEQFSFALDRDDAILLVAESAGQIAGAVCAKMIDAPGDSYLAPSRFLLIDTLVVREKFRRNGIGKALLDKAHRWGKEKGAVRAALSVWEFNQNAIKAYEKLGYQTMIRRMWLPFDDDI